MHAHQYVTFTCTWFHKISFRNGVEKCTFFARRKRKDGTLPQILGSATRHSTSIQIFNPEYPLKPRARPPPKLAHKLNYMSQRAVAGPGRRASQQVRGRQHSCFSFAACESFVAIWGCCGVCVFTTVLVWRRR